MKRSTWSSFSWTPIKPSSKLIRKLWQSGEAKASAKSLFWIPKKLDDHSYKTAIYGFMRKFTATILLRISERNSQTLLKGQELWEKVTIRLGKKRIIKSNSQHFEPFAKKPARWNHLGRNSWPNRWKQREQQASAALRIKSILKFTICWCHLRMRGTTGNRWAICQGRCSIG